MNLRAIWLPAVLACSFVPPLAAAADRFKLEDGVVKDARTGLHWQAAVDGASYSFADASSYCKGLTLSGGGWRLPAMKELLTLVDPTHTSPAIDERAFPGTPSAWFWSASPDVRDPTNSGWKVFFFDGTSGNELTSGKNRVRCVR